MQRYENGAITKRKMKEDILEYHGRLDVCNRDICELLYQAINQNLPQAESKIWHAHPVWFLDGNPIVGYDKLKDGVRLMFWSGQSFDEFALQNSGKFKAAVVYYENSAQIDLMKLEKWLKKAILIQWDYKNIVKRKGVLERLK